MHTDTKIPITKSSSIHEKTISYSWFIIKANVIHTANFILLLHTACHWLIWRLLLPQHKANFVFIRLSKITYKEQENLTISPYHEITWGLLYSSTITLSGLISIKKVIMTFENTSYKMLNDGEWNTADTGSYKFTIDNKLKKRNLKGMWKMRSILHMSDEINKMRKYEETCIDCEEHSIISQSDKFDYHYYVNWCHKDI